MVEWKHLAVSLPLKESISGFLALYKHITRICRSLRNERYAPIFATP
jgi:hypothetical protein